MMEFKSGPNETHTTPLRNCVRYRGRRDMGSLSERTRPGRPG